jgi:multidrug efflux pump
VPITSIHNTISAAFGSAYVNDFIQGGRVKRVYVQADAPYRMLPRTWKNSTCATRRQDGALFLLCLRPLDQRLAPLERFNGFPSMNIWGEPAPGRSSGEAMAGHGRIVAKLPQGIGFDWTGLSYQERMAGAQAPLLYAFSILVIFLCLAALYESWPIPISILLICRWGPSAA